MKRNRRVAAILLAAAVLLNGTPLFSAGAVQEGDPVLGGVVEEPVSDGAADDPVSDGTGDEPVSDGAGEGSDSIEVVDSSSTMKLVQTGFDSNTGIVTMTLKVKVPGADSLEPGAGWEEEGHRPGTYVGEGMLMFQTDSTTVIPITCPDSSGAYREIVPDGLSMAYVIGDDPDHVTDMVLGKLTGEKGRGQRILGGASGTEGSFNALMLPAGSGAKFREDHSGYLVSSARDKVSKLDCYLQFRYNTTVFSETGPDGYANVIDLYFLCKEYGTDGSLVPGGSDSCLFYNSFRIPGAEEARDMTEQFCVKTHRDPATGDSAVDPASLTMAMGLAGYRVKVVEPGGSPKLKEAYYYGARPTATEWRNDLSDVSGLDPIPDFWEKASLLESLNPGDTGVGLEYANMDQLYVLSKLVVGNKNTYKAYGGTGEDYDFGVPVGESESYQIPRYAVPTKAQVTENDNTKNWTPQAYINWPDTPAQRVALKYQVGTEVTKNSAGRPEALDFEGFISNLQWRIALPDGRLLDDCPVVEDEGEALKVPTVNEDFYYVKEGTIQESGYAYHGYKVQNVYSSDNVLLMTTPLGVTLDMALSEITYTVPKEGQEEEDVKTAMAAAPQIHITARAADSRNCIWKPAQNTYAIGEFQLAAFLEDESLSMPLRSATDTTVKLYMEASKPTVLEIDSERMVTEEDSRYLSFAMGVPYGDGSTDVLNDEVAVKGIPFTVTLRDQYDNAVAGKEHRPTVTIAPDTETFAALKDAGRSTELFRVMAVEPDPAPEDWSKVILNSYTIKYKPGKDVKDGLKGRYIITASYGGITPQTVEARVTRDDDVLSYLNAMVSGGVVSPSNPEQVEISVPTLNESGAVRSGDVKILITELANQWRVPSNAGQSPKACDIVPGLRDEDSSGETANTINIEKARNKLDALTFEVTYPDEYEDDPAMFRGIDITNINNGIIHYDTTVQEGAKVYVTVTAKYQAAPAVKKTYTLIFRRQPATLSKIMMKETVNQIIIPSSSDGSKETLFAVFLRDQYDTDHAWSYYYKLDPNTEPWTLKSKEPLPVGVSLVGTNHATLKIEPTATKNTIRLYAQCGTVVSKELTVTIDRDPSKPVNIRSIRYDSFSKVSGIPAPALNEPAITVAPTLVVADQYSAEMVSDDYRMEWSFAQTPDSKIQLNKDTGELTVSSGAPTTNLSLNVKIYEKAGPLAIASYNFTNIAVARRPADITVVEVKEKEVPYPTIDADSALSQLSARYSSQYGDEEDCDEAAVAWTLLTYTRMDGTKLTYGKLETDGEGITSVVPSGGGILLQGNTYVAGNLKFTDSGAFTFTSITEESQLPQSVEVVASYKSKFSAVTTVDITRKAQIPTQLVIPRASYAGGITVPDLGQTYTLTPQAFVRDQYGVNMKDPAIAWSFTAGKAPQGVKLDRNTGKLTADNTAKAGSFSVTATYTVYSDDREHFLTDEMTIYSKMDDAYVSNVDITGVKGSKTPLEILLPGVLDKPVSYTLEARMQDQRGDPTSEATTWSIVSSGTDSNLQAKIVNADSGELQVSYSKSASSEMTLKVRAQVTNYKLSSTDPHYTVTKEQVITLKRAAAVPTYAAVESREIPLESSEALSNGDTAVVVPQRNSPGVKVTYTAGVYDQYENLLPQAAATMKLNVSSQGMSFAMTEEKNQGQLTISSDVLLSSATVVAFPAGQPEKLLAGKSTNVIRVSKGQGYLDELKLLDDAAGSPQWAAPLWNTSAVANVGSEKNTAVYTLSAMAVDQYGKQFSSNNDAYLPRWEIVEENLEGVSFTEGTQLDSSGRPMGKEISVAVSCDILKAGESSKTIHIRARCIQGPENEYFVKTIPVTISRMKPTPTYQYFPEANEDGIWEVPRPVAAEGQTGASYSLFPQLYDQYGTELSNGKFRLVLDEELLGDENGVQVEKRFAPGASEEEGDSPIAYTIKNSDGQTMAELDLETGVIQVTRYCKLSRLYLTAYCTSIEGAPGKSVYLRITEDEAVPAVLELDKSNYDITVHKDQGGGGGAMIYTPVSATIYDQYGEAYGSAGVKVQWGLRMADNPDDTYKEYMKNEDGELTAVEKMESDYLLTKPAAADAGRSTTLIVNPENYEERTEAVLRAEVRKASGGIVNTVEVVNAPVVVNVTTGSGISFLKVTFEAGEYGLLVGEKEIEMTAGSTVEKYPGVKTKPGYAFLGWTMDGETLSDLPQTNVYGDTTFYAVYKDITGTKFLSGYEDNTIRPERHISRAEFTKMVVEAIGGYNETVDYGPSFTDVSSKKWYANYIAYAKKKAYISGYENGDFRPEKSITRGEAAKLLVTALGEEALPGSSFEDVQEGQWYAGFVEALVKAGIVEGYEDGTFHPEKNIKRSEAVKMIILITENAPKGMDLENLIRVAYCPFADVKKIHWYFPYVVRAAGVA